MTISSEEASIRYDVAGGVVDFPITFDFLDDADNIAVYDITDGYPDKVTLTQGVDYTVGGIPADPEVNLMATRDGSTIEIRRVVPFTQETDLPVTGALPAASVETALDKLTMLVQQLLDLLATGDITLADFMRKLDAESWDGQSLRVANVAAGVDGGDAVNLAQLQATAQGIVPATISGNGVFVFSGDGVETDYELTGLPLSISPEDVFVFVHGVHQLPSSATAAYSIDATGSQPVLRFATAPPSATSNIVVLSVEGVVTASLGGLDINGSLVTEGTLPATAITPAAAIRVLGTAGSPLSVQWLALNVSYISDIAAWFAAKKVTDLTPPTSAVAFGSQQLTGVAAGSSSTHAVNKGQIDDFRKAKTGQATFASGSVSIDFAFTVGFVSLTVATAGGGLDAGDSYSCVFTSNAAHAVDIGGDIITFTRSSIAGGTRVTLSGPSGSPVVNYFASEGNS